MRHLGLFALKGCLFILAGLMTSCCVVMGPGAVFKPSTTTPANVLLTSVPFFPQQKDQCGPAALAMALCWAGIEIRPEQLTTAVYTPGRKGSLQSALVTAARRHGRLAYPVTGMDCLVREVAAGRPVIVLQNLGLKWIPRWHYAVVVGFDLDERYVVLHSGDIAGRRVGFNTFASTWGRSEHWALGVMPADQMPECAEPAPFLNAALGLQLAGHPKYAMQAYGNAVERWPHSIEAAIALGNAFYEKGDAERAIHMFRRAVRIEPGNADALNNLAHLLAESGELEKARGMAQRALKAGGPHAHVYQQTLDEIEDKLKK